MWYLVMTFFFSNHPTIDIITNQKFESLDECLSQEMYFNSEEISYSKMCIFEDDLEIVGYDHMTGDQNIVFVIPE